VKVNTDSYSWMCEGVIPHEGADKLKYHLQSIKARLYCSLLCITGGLQSQVLFWMLIVGSRL
jgi:hypothetical protein